MKEYAGDKIRNIGIVAHGSAGKTSLLEALLFTAGAVKRLGRVDDGSTTTDFEPEEIKRKVTIGAALAPCEWKDHKINFLDTPGYADFVSEVKGGLRAVDSALVVVCAVSGVEVETEKVWQYAENLKMPRMLFVNKMDRENADFFGTVEQIQGKFGKRAIPIEIPIGAQEEFSGVVNLLTMKAVLTQGTQEVESAIPESMLPQAEAARQELLDMAAEADDDLLEKYLEGEELSTAEIAGGLLNGISRAELFPILCGSAYKNVALPLLLDAAVHYLPPAVKKNVIGYHPLTQEVLERKANDAFSAMVFKTTADPFVGRLSYIRVFSGMLKPDSSVYNASKGKVERIGNLFTLRGKQQETVPVLRAGDIGVVAKLQDTATGDSLCDKDRPIVFLPIDYPKPMFSMRLEARNRNDEDKIGSALQRLLDEDPTLVMHKETEPPQLVISGMGELHIDIMVERLKRKFGVDVLLSQPKIPYRETIRSAVKIEGKHKKQSGGHGQYGHVWLQIEPLEPGAGFVFQDSIFGGAVPRQYIPAVEKGVREALAGGVLAGFPIVDVKVTLTDGSYHTVDSSEMAFKIASGLALRKGVLQAKPVLLEPICNIEVEIPEQLMGDIIGDLNGKRGRILGMENVGAGIGVVRAQAPLAEVFRYALDLRSLTQGRGCFDMKFSHYEEVPQRIADAVIAGAKKDKMVDEM
ncbi:Elongation factor G [Propionispora sp. 2/2-37]|uniref:elongation factor G n=1 Tax=Propionispora sp. 2/2-37 TaxID=1677858 RepID=UPI0006BB8B02|nr:elongation factor G [Propionispora sp. 2/2-37]CUH95578.1 Elongation factor G [Propionispora sp. 2/2-37]